MQTKSKNISQANNQNESILLQTLSGQKPFRAPVWIMRQAGRYLPEYQSIRSKYDFQTMYKTPELAVEISLQPIRRFEMDAAIVFSDIMIIPEAMGMKVEFIEGKGPVFEYPLTTEESILGLEKMQLEKLHYTLDAIRILDRELPSGIPVIGFAGAPFTLAKYMTDGKNLKTNRNLKELRYGRPDLLHILLSKITDAIIDYCHAMIDRGVKIIQIFDSSAGLLDHAGFTEFAWQYSKKIFDSIKTNEVYTIYFSRSTGQWLRQISGIGSDVFGLDWTISPEAARAALGSNANIQGNLDPGVLYADRSIIRENVASMISSFSEFDQYIANLGHGILPDIPVDSVHEFVDTVKEESAKIYSRIR
ncbi:MAG: uroporphyrinogen decarboxylase [Candidatus Kapaibacterium sp.]